MILSDIKQYLEQRGSASLADISVHFDTEPDAIRGMLEQWIRKGRVSRHTANAACGGSCNRCDTDNTEIYQWVDAASNSIHGYSIKVECGND